jgi:hypothetical protein
MTTLVQLLLRVLLLPLFVLVIAPVGLVVRHLADPLCLRRSTRASYLRDVSRGGARPTLASGVAASRRA